jgi:hypothetical protein
LKTGHQNNFLISGCRSQMLKTRSYANRCLVQIQMRLFLKRRLPLSKKQGPKKCRQQCQTPQERIELARLAVMARCFPRPSTPGIRESFIFRTPLIWKQTNRRYRSPPFVVSRFFALPFLDLSFRELGRTTGTPKTGFLSFDTTGVSSQKVGIAEQRLELGVEVLQRAGDTKLAGVGLTSLATTVNANYYVNFFTLRSLQQGS